jgi:hypothetical protein
MELPNAIGVALLEGKGVNQMTSQGPDLNMSIQSTLGYPAQRRRQ